MCFKIQQAVSRFEAVCQGCSAAASDLPDGVHINNQSGTPSCKELPEGTVALSSGTTVESLTLLEGYYRTSNQSSAVLECYRSEACVGGDDPGNYCAEGYEGACEYTKYLTVPICTILAGWNSWLTRSPVFDSARGFEPIYINGFGQKAHRAL